jgi:hypothetical protein
VGIERFRCFGILPCRDTKEEDSPDSLFLQAKHCWADIFRSTARSGSG